MPQYGTARSLMVRMGRSSTIPRLDGNHSIRDRRAQSRLARAITSRPAITRVKIGMTRSRRPMMLQTLSSRGARTSAMSQKFIAELAAKGMMPDGRADCSNPGMDAPAHAGSIQGSNSPDWQAKFACRTDQPHAGRGATKGYSRLNLGRLLHSATICQLPSTINSTLLGKSVPARLGGISNSWDWHRFRPRCDHV